MSQVIAFIRYFSLGICLIGIVASFLLVVRLNRLPKVAWAPLSWIIHAVIFYAAIMAVRNGILKPFGFLPFWSPVLGAHAAGLFTGALVLIYFDRITFRNR